MLLFFLDNCSLLQCWWELYSRPKFLFPMSGTNGLPILRQMPLYCAIHATRDKQAMVGWWSRPELLYLKGVKLNFVKLAVYSI